MEEYLIADSGGTKTDWCFVDKLGKKTFFTTESYHPVNWSKEFVQRIDDFWKEHAAMKKAKLFFFGAGCLKAEKSKELEAIFKRIGFSSISVKSDLHAAGLALLGGKDGSVAIMGTGSVLFDWENGNVSNIKGGKGHKMGDEGSGFYFGKLVYEAYLNDELDEVQKSVFEKLNLEEIRNKIAKDDAKFVLAQVAFHLRDYQQLFAKWHQINFLSFYKSHMQERKLQVISFVGSYAFYHSSHLKKELEKFNVQIEIIISEPIGYLIERIVPSIE